MSQKLIISIADSLKVEGLTVEITGRSGASYPFVWNDKHSKHIYLGNEITAKELNQVAVDIFTRTRRDHYPVVEAVIDPYQQEEAEAPKVAKKLKAPAKEQEEQLIPEQDLPPV